MNAGRLDRKIELHSPTTTTDSFGQSSETFAKVADVWAMKKDTAAREIVEADQLVAMVRTEWTIRHRTDINETWIVKYESTDYEIKGILEIGRREGLRLITEKIDVVR